MKRMHIPLKQTSVHDFYATWDDLYDEISSDWQQKAHRLLKRKQRLFNRGIDG